MYGRGNSAETQPGTQAHFTDAHFHFHITWVRDWAETQTSQPVIKGTLSNEEGDSNVDSKEHSIVNTITVRSNASSWAPARSYG